MKLNCIDYVNISEHLNDDELMVQHTTREFVDKEIIPISIKNKKGDLSVRVDEEPLKFNEEKIKLLKPAFNKGGSITAANASSLNDGAAVILVASQNKTKELNLKPIARIVAHCSFAMDPVHFTKAPIYAIHKVIKTANLDIRDIDLFEINEAFSVVPMAAMKDLNIDSEKVNIYVNTKNKSLPEEVKLSIWNDESIFLKGRLELLLKNALIGLVLLLFIHLLNCRESLNNVHWN